MESKSENNDKRRKATKQKRSLLMGRVHNRSRHVGFWMCIGLVVIAAFVGGFAVRSNTTLMLSLGVPMDEVADSSTTSAISKTKTSYDSLSARVSEVEDMLTTFSLDETPLAEATEALLTGLMESTGDPYAEYFTEERYKSYVMENADRNLSGVGVLFADYDGRAYAMDVLADSEAQAEGVRQGDFVVAIDGDHGHTWSASEVIARLAKEEGDSVIITWMRPISLDAVKGEEFTTTLVCGEFSEQNVDYYLEEQVGYIKLRQFTSSASELVSNAVEDLVGQGAQAFVLDIRDNPGGFLTQSLDTASLFVPSGVLVGIETNEGTSTRNASGSPITAAPLVVLVNGYTSGVAEVLAAAVQDNQRATTVGQTTTGKGSVQVTRELTFGGAIRYTAAYYLTPLGQQINGAGVVPNVEVEAGEDEEGNDHQLSVAMEIARSQIEA